MDLLSGTAKKAWDVASFFLDSAVGGTAWVVKKTMIPSNLSPGPDFHREQFPEHLEFAEQGMKWSRLAYSIDNDRDVEKDDNGVTKFITTKSTDTQVIVGVAGKTALVAYRGSTSFKDWVVNFIVTPEQAQDQGFSGSIVKGFLWRFQDSNKLVTEELMRVLKENDVEALHLTGHSLGGALITLYGTAMYPKLREAHPDMKIRMTTFGSPKVGNEEFAAQVDEVFGLDYHRWVNQNDVVTRMPPGYSHAGLLHYLAEDRTLWTAKSLDKQRSWLFRFSDWLEGYTRDGIANRGIDHLTDSYIKSLKAAENKKLD